MIVLLVLAVLFVMWRLGFIGYTN
jgi:hypothetical protein